MHPTYRSSRLQSESTSSVDESPRAGPPDGGEAQSMPFDVLERSRAHRRTVR